MEKRNNLTWTMNCILFGASISKLLQQGKDIEVLQKIKELHSGFDDMQANYLLKRLKSEV